MARPRIKDAIMPAPAPAKETPSGALARGLAILQILIEAPQPMSLADVAAAARLDQSTALRLLRSLEDAHYVLRASAGRRYVASPAALSPLPLLHPLASFRREAQPSIERLANTIKETVVLALFQENERLVIDIAQTSGSLAPYYSTWLHGPLQCSATGKALLLNRDPETRRELLGEEPYHPHTPFSMTTLDEVEKDLEAAAARGYVISRDEHRLGQTTLAVSINSWEGAAVGCLAVTALTRDMDERRLEAVVTELRSTAELLPHQARSLRASVQYLGGAA